MINGQVPRGANIPICLQTIFSLTRSLCSRKSDGFNRESRRLW